MTGKTVIVTGGGRGIGRAICVKFAQLGANVVINYAGDATAAQQTLELCRQAGGNGALFQADVADSGQSMALIDFAVAQFGKVDVLVNNAGITKDGLLLRMSEDDFDRVIDVNLKGTFHCIKGVSRLFTKQRSGRIINITSVVGLMGNAGQANYVASKAGVVGLTKTAARELASRGITVNAIAPGFIQTDMTDVLKEEIKQQMLQNIPLGSFGTPEDVANAVAFLASEQAQYITGQVLSVNGGMYM